MDSRKIRPATVRLILELMHPPRRPVLIQGAQTGSTAVESADLAFTGTGLRSIPAAFADARRGRRIMTGNIGLALAIIIAIFPLALFGVIGLAGVVPVHELAEVVIFNGLQHAPQYRSRAPAGSGRSIWQYPSNTLAPEDLPIGRKLKHEKPATPHAHRGFPPRHSGAG